MNKIALVLLSFYQHVLSPLLKNILGVPSMCRFNPTCSEYARHSIVRHGILQGGKMSILRILSCQPFAKIAV